MRSRSLYQDGMLPRISYMQEDGSRGPWSVSGAVTASVKFYPTTQDPSFDQEFLNKERNFYTLSFIYTVTTLNESIFFAYDVPYTFNGDLTRYLKKLSMLPDSAKIMRREVLCKTMTGLDCPMMTITEDAKYLAPYEEIMRLVMWKDARDRAFLQSEVNRSCNLTGFSIERKRKELREKIDNRLATGGDVSQETRYTEHLFMHHGKKAMVITARVHPAECQASYSLEGAVDFLMSNDPRAQRMRKDFIIYVIPMLNIEGVVHGNQRTNLAGYDLNRRWAEPSPYITPVIFTAKNLMKIIEKERQIVMACDMHGHF